MSGQAQNQAQTNQVVCFEYRFTGMGARTEYIFLKVNGRIKRLEPLWTRRSKTGNHGMDCYTATFLRKADAEVVVQVSNSGKHYCSLKLYRQLSKEELLKLSKWLAENEHICEQIAMDLVKYGLPEDVLLDLVQRDP